MLHGAVLRSPHPHARLGEIRAKAALALPGVHRGGHRGGSRRRRPHPRAARPPGPSNVACLQPPLARDKVRYVGEPVAVVVAESRYLAEDALDLVDVDYDPLPAVPDVRRALAPGSPVLHAAIEGNLVDTIEHPQGRRGRRPLRARAYRVRERFSVQRHTGVPDGDPRPHRGPLIRGTGVLRLWGVAKVPHFNRRVLADLLGHPEHLIHFVELEVGGGFGVRGEFYPEDLVIPWLAMRLGRPVQWIEDRREHLMATNHSRQQSHDIEIGFDRDGRIVALADRFVVDMGAYIRTHGVVVPGADRRPAAGTYRIPNYSCRDRVRAHEQDANRHVSRPRSVRMHVRP